MRKSQRPRPHPLEHPAEALWSVAFGAAGQLLLGWMLARAAQSAEQEEDLQLA
jgi:hypothetical protein